MLFIIQALNLLYALVYLGGAVFIALFLGAMVFDDPAVANEWWPLLIPLAFAVLPLLLALLSVLAFIGCWRRRHAGWVMALIVNAIACLGGLLLFGLLGLVLLLQKEVKDRFPQACDSGSATT